MGLYSTWERNIVIIRVFKSFLYFAIVWVLIIKEFHRYCTKTILRDVIFTYFDIQLKCFDWKWYPATLSPWREGAAVYRLKMTDITPICGKDSYFLKYLSEPRIWLANFTGIFSWYRPQVTDCSTSHLLARNVRFWLTVNYLSWTFHEMKT